MQMLMQYVVCTRCTFLRAYSKHADGQHALASCPACGGEVIARESEERFPPTYVSRVSLELAAAPPLGI